MKKILSLCFLAYLPLLAQSPDYYQSAQELTGEELRNELHEIIKAHNEFSYSSTKNILRLADEDPQNENNVILVYKGNSISKDDFSTNMQQDFWNREHVWVKSQGGFTGDETYGALGAYSDAHNLKPCDASINTARGTKDFDNGGTQNSEATGCYSTSNTWEPRDEVKGDVARIIFYMATRYMGDPGEPSLNVVDYINNSSDPLMGKLSTLLEWNEQDPVDAFERRRNQVIFNWQQNRNPFIDYPELANLIWAEADLNPLVFNSVELQSNAPSETESQEVYAQIFSDVNTPVQSVTLTWGTSWADIYDGASENVIQMTEGDVSWTATIPALPEGTDVKYQITASADGLQNTFYGNYVVALNPFEGTITSIQDVQGTGDYSPFEDQTISTKGVVTAVLGDDFYMQDGEGPRSGIYVYTSPVIPSIGDSVIVTGEVSEFQWEDPTPEKMTELAYPDQVYILNSNNPTPNPIDITTGGLANEDYEGMLVRVTNVTATYATFNFDDYGQWRVNDGTGECNIHNTQEGYEYPAEVGEYISSITGVSTYLFGEWKISLRMEDDVDGGSDLSGPSIIETTVLSENSIALFFNENVEISSAENLSNYSINNGIVVESASRHPFQWSRVNLTTSLHVAGDYQVTVSNVMDELGNSTSGTQGYYSIDEPSGCTDSVACNYSPTVTLDDGSCNYAELFYDCNGNCLNDGDEDDICDELEVPGCTNPNATNYNSNATDDDGTCIILGCTDQEACNWDAESNSDDGSCIYAEMYYNCDGSCINDFDMDGQCDEIDYDDGIGINEIETENAQPIKMIDVLGREYKKHKKGMLLFYIYENGKVEKKIK